VVRVANLAFLKPDFVILAFLEIKKIKKAGNQKKPDKIWLFFSRKAWLWQGIV